MKARMDEFTKISAFFHDQMTDSQGLCLESIDDLVMMDEQLYVRNPRKGYVPTMLVSHDNGDYTLHRDGKQFTMNRQTAIKLARLSVAYWWQGNPDGTWKYSEPKPFSRFQSGRGLS